MKLPDRLCPGRLRAKAAYTLMELLVVISILLVLLGFVTPATLSILDSRNLTRAGELLVDQINLARQTAAARNCPVEVRLFKLSSNSPEGYSAVQLWMTGTSGNLSPFTKAVSLPSGIVVAQDTALSMAFAQAPSPLPTATVGSVSNAPYVAFQVRPTGIVDPALNMNAWYMTLVAAHFASSSSLPENYVTVQINPFTATPRIYRP